MENLKRRVFEILKEALIVSSDASLNRSDPDGYLIAADAKEKILSLMAPADLTTVPNEYDPNFKRQLSFESMVAYYRKKLEEAFETGEEKERNLGDVNLKQSLEKAGHAQQDGYNRNMSDDNNSSDQVSDEPRFSEDVDRAPSFGNALAVPMRSNTSQTAFSPRPAGPATRNISGGFPNHKP